MRILVVDVGGTHIKVAGSWNHGPDIPPIKIDSGPTLSAQQMVADVRALTADWEYDAVSIGYPGVVRDGHPAIEPRNLGTGWVEMDFADAFGKPVRLINDAAMQALGSFRNGRMLFLGLGTGLGTAVVTNGVVEPLELAHLPYRKGKSFEDVVGEAGLERLGRKRWERHVHVVVTLLQQAMLCDSVVLGGGNARKLKALPRFAECGSNEHAIDGGIKLWNSNVRVIGSAHI